MPLADGVADWGTIGGQFATILAWERTREAILRADLTILWRNWRRELMRDRQWIEIR